MGRSSIVGTPLVSYSRKSEIGNATVTLAHSRTKNLASICREADILIVAIGKPAFVNADMVKEGAVVVDVGIHRIEDKSKKMDSGLLAMSILMKLLQNLLISHLFPVELVQ